MRILGIETSCDETAAAVVENGTVVHSNVIASQIALHQLTGGVVPEVAAREHVLKIIPVIAAAITTSDVEKCALLSNMQKTAGKSTKAGTPTHAQIASARPPATSTATREVASLMASIDAIAVTQGPGLLSSLVIGTTAASTLATYFNKPLIPVNHIAGHIYANWLDENPDDPILFPILILTVSGGHNELVLMRSHAQFQLLGETLDDAAGEAFDKVARLLNLGYPGGPAISKAAESGDPSKYPFTKAQIHKDSFDFSFSGLKTAVLNLVQQEYKKQLAATVPIWTATAPRAVASSGRTAVGPTTAPAPPPAVPVRPGAAVRAGMPPSSSEPTVITAPTLSPQFIADCAASFQDSVCQILTDKLLRAAEKYKVKEVHLAGGVSANKHLRAVAKQKIEEKFHFDHNNHRVKILVSPRLRYPQNISYCTDNAAMIAAAAYFLHRTRVKNSGHTNSFVSPAGLLEQSNAPMLADPGLNLYDTHEA